MQRTSPTKRKFSAGMTIVELAVVVAVMPLVISLFIYAVYSGVDSASLSKIRVELASRAGDAMDVIERDVRYSLAYNKTVPAAYTDPYGANNSGTSGSQAWSFKGVPESATQRILILSAPSTTVSPVSSARVPVYLAGSFSCVTQMALNDILPNVVLYFVRDNVLYRRILTDTAATTCNGPQIQKQSCPGNVNPWDAICAAKDEALAEDVSGFAIDYYVERVTTPISDAYTSSDDAILNTADDVSVSLTLGRLFAGDTVEATSTLRVSKVNQ